MALKNDTPIVIPAMSEKSFPDIWLYNISIMAPGLDSGRITIETLPYNSETQEIGNGSMMVPIHTDQLWDAVNEVPEVAQAMGAIFAAVGPLRDWVNKMGVYAPIAEEPIVE